MFRYVITSWNLTFLSANPTKWSNTDKQNFRVFDYFVWLALKGKEKYLQKGKRFGSEKIFPSFKNALF